MITIDEFAEILASLKHDPEKEDNWSALTEALRDPEAVEDLPLVREKLDGIIGFFEKYEDWDYVARLLRTRYEIEEDDDIRADLALKLAKIFDGETFEAKKAKESYEEVLRLRPGDEEAGDGLNQLKAVRKKWRDVVEQYLREAGDSDQPSFKSNLYLQIAGLYQKYGGRAKDKKKDILHYLQLALEADPANKSASGFLKRILVKDRAWEDLVALYQRLAEVARTKEDRVDAMVQRARILVGKMERSDEAAEVYSMVLELQPGNQPAMAFLVDYYTAAGLSDHLVALYEDILKTRPKGDDELATLLQIGMVHWRMREEVDKAETYFRKIKRIQPNHPAALNFYRSVHAQSEDWPKLIQVLNEAVRGTKENEAKIALYEEIADVAHEKMGNVERAIDAYKAIAKIDPENEQAQSRLKQLYRSGEKWNALLDVLKKEVRSLDGQPDEQVAVLAEIVGIYKEHLKLEPMVIKTYHQMLDVQPANEEAIEALGEIYESSKRWNDLIGVLDKRVAMEEDPARKVELLTRITGIWIDSLSNYNKAVEPLEQILDIQPDNREVMLQLKQIYEQRRSWEPLLGLLEKELEFVEEEDRLEHLSTMAQIAAERLGRQSEAIELYWKVLELAPGDEDVMVKVEKLCERQKQWQDLARILEMRLEHMEDDQNKIPLFMKLGGVYGDHLENLESAVDVWKRLLAIQPSHPKALRILKETYIRKRDWDSLVEMFAEHENWDQLADTLNSTSESVEEDEDRILLSFKAAEIYRDRLGNMPRAVRAYERILGADPKNREAALELLPVYEKDSNWSNLAAMHEVLLETAQDDEERIERMKILVDVHGDRLRDPKKAFELASGAYKLAPLDEDVEAALALYGESLGAWSELVGLYHDRLEDAEDDEVLRLRHTVADILFNRLDEVEEALTEYKSILAASPGDDVAYDAIENILTSTGRLEELIKFYEDKLESVEDPSERIGYWQRMAKICQEGMDDIERASIYYVRILELDDSHGEALAELETIYRITEKWEELASILGKRREMAEGDDLTEVVLEIGKVLSTHLGRHDEAIDDFSKVLDDRPGDREAVEALERYLDDEERRLRVAGLLENHLASLEKFSQLASVKRILLEAAGDPREKLERTLSLAAVYVEHLGEAGSAFDILDGALVEFPSDESLWDRLEELAGATDRWHDMKQRYERLFEDEDVDEGVKREIARRIARICEERIQEPEAAERFHRWVFEREPLDQGSFQALETLFTNADRYQDLRALYRERVENLVEVSDKLELLQKVGFLEEDLLENAGNAIETYREMLGLEPENELALKALERLYEASERWEELADLLEAHIGEVPEEGIVAARYRLGEILDVKLGERSRALDYYRLVLADYPTHLHTQSALEKLLDDQELRQEVAGILEGIYESQGANTELARILQIRLEGAEDDHDKVELLLKLAEIQDKRLHDGDGAYENLARAFNIDPANEEIRHALELIVEQNDLWPIYADELEEISGKVEDSMVLGPILFDLGNIMLSRIGDDDKALSAFNRFLDSGYEEPQSILGASRALESLYIAREDYANIVRVLSVQLDHLESMDEKVEILRRIGEIREVNLEATADAISTYLEILDLVPGDMESIYCLERLYERAESWEELIGILERRSEAGVSEEEWLEIRFKIADIQKTKLEELDEAIFTYLAITERVTSREALEALVELYDRTGATSDLVETLDRLRRLSEDPAEQASILFRIGEVERERSGDLYAAVERYKQVLEIDSGHQGAREAMESVIGEEDVRLSVARILAPLYELEQNYEKLIETVDIEIAEESDPAERDRLFRRGAEVAEIGLGDPSRAFGYFARAFRQVVDHPDGASAVEELERIASETESWSDLVELFSLVAPDVYEPELQLRLYLRIAQLQLHQMENLDAARDWYVKLLDIVPDNMEAIEALERIYWQQERWSSLLEILRRKTDLTQDPTERVTLLFQQAEICEEKLDDPAMAIDAYEDVLEMEENRDAVHALERLYMRTERWGNYRDIVERQLDWPGADEVDLHHRLGKILADNLGDPQAALENFQEALRLDPTHEETISILETWLEDSSFREQVAELLEPIYISAMRFDKVQSIIQVRLEFVQDPELRKELFQRSGEIWEEQLEDLDQAFDVYVKMFEEDPEDQEVRGNIDRLGNVLDIWPRVADAYRKVLDDRLTEDETTAEMARHLGMVCDNYCGDAEGAVGAFRRALNIDPADQESFNALEAIFHREERWEDLFNLYRDVADGMSDLEMRRSILYLMGQLCEEKLADRGRAIDIFREVLDVAADDPTAIGALERLYYYEERFHDLADLLHMRIDRADNAAELLELKYRLATVYDEHLGDRNSAIDLCEEILNQDSTYRDAVSALESILEDEDHRLRVAQILIPYYRQEDDWRNLAGAYRAELEFLTDPIDRMERLREIADLSENRGGDQAGAMSAWAEALLEDPADADVLGHLQRLAEAQERWGDLVQILEKALDKTDMSSVRSGLLRLAARILDRHLGDFNEAVGMYKRLLEEEEGDMEALEALDSLYTLLADWEGLLDALDLKVQYTIDQEQAKALRRRQGEVCEDQVGDNSRAVEHYVQALEIDPADIVTIENLERLHEVTEKWNDLENVLQQKLSAVQQPEERREVHLKLAAVYQEKLEDLDQAINSYLAVLEEFTDDVEVMKVLDSLFAHEERWDDYYQNLERRAAVTVEEDEVIGIQLQMAKVLTEALGDVDRAIDIYRQVLEVREVEDALLALEAIAREETHRAQVIAILEPIYRRSGNWEKLLDLQKLQLEIISDPAERVDLQLQIADLYDRGLGDRENAFATYLQALGEEGWNEELYRQAEATAEQLDRWQDFAEALESKAGAVYDSMVTAELNMRLGRIWEERLGNLDGAIGAYRRILDQGADETEALEALDRLYYHQERWEDLVEIIQKKLFATTDVEQQNMLGLRLGEIREQRFEDYPGAIQAYSDVFERDPANPEAIAALEALLDREIAMEDIIEILSPAYRAGGNLRKLVELLDIKAAVMQMPEERVAVLREEARIAEEELQDPEAAFQAYGKAIWEMPDDRDLMEELERLSEMLGGWESLSAHIGRILEEHELEDDIRRDMTLKLAKWAKDRLQDPEAAIRWYAAYLEMEPENVDAMRDYEVALEAMGRDEALVDVLEKRQELEYDFEAKKEALQRIADIATQRLGDRDRAARAYEKLVETDESDVVAVDALMGIRADQEDWDGVIELVRMRLVHTPDPGEANALRHRLADLYHTVKQDADEAIEVLREILSVDPEDAQAATALEELYQQGEMWFDLKELVISRLDGVTEPALRAHAHKRLAELAEKRFEDLDDAVNHLYEAYNIDPLDGDVLDGLERLLSATGRLDDLINLLEQRARECASTDPGTELALLVRIGEIYHKQLEDTTRAVEYYEKVLEREPNHVLALAALADLHEQAGDWERCISVLDQAAQNAQDMKVMGDIFYKIGIIKRDRMDDMVGALESFNAVLEVYPEHAEVLATLKEYFEQEKDWGRYASILEVEERMAPDEETRLGILLELARVMRDGLQAPDQALQYLEQANELKPGDADVLSALVDAYIESGRTADAIPMIEKLIEAEQQTAGKRSKKLAALYLQLGQAYEKQGDRDRALAEYENANRIDLTNFGVNYRLGLLYRETGDVDKAMKMLRPLLLQNLQSQGIDKADVYYILGELHAQKGETVKAISMLDRGLSQNRDHEGIKALLAQLKG